MPWQTPTLRDIRSINRDYAAAYLADATIPNSPLRILSDENAGWAHSVLLYLDFIANNLLPDRSETEWLDRWADIYFGGRKSETYASGPILLTGATGTLVNVGSQLVSPDRVVFQTTEEVYLSPTPTEVNVLALTAGAIGNRDQGARLNFVVAISGADPQGVVVRIAGGADAEKEPALRNRLLLRIRETPMGGDRNDYVQWALDVPGVTRAWVAPLEMGIGTVTVRFMMDDLRASNGGFPLPEDVEAVREYLDTVRPVAVKDFFAFGPIAFPFSVAISDLSNDTPSTRVAIEKALQDMLCERAKPGGTVYAVWQAEAVSGALGEDHHDADYQNIVMPSGGHMAVLSSITYP